MKNKKYKGILILTLILLIFAFSVIAIKYPQTEVSAGANVGALSNQKIGWGIKRNDNHEQPDLGKKNLQLLEEVRGMAMGNKDKKYIYLTFDEGYEAGYTQQILATLKEKQVKATFFITAHYVNTQPDLVKQMIDEGHIVGNHTVNHKSMPDLTDEKINTEIMELHKVVQQKFGYEMKYLRPPMGEYSQRTLALTKSLGYTTVMWSFAYQDWDEKKQPNEQEALQKIVNNVHPGEIMLLHGNSKTNTNILGKMIDEVRPHGYEFKSLNEFEF